MEFTVILSVLVLSSLLHFGIQKIFIFYKKFDDFNHRSSHKTLATRTGGIGIFTTILLTSLYFYFRKIELFDYSLFIPLGIMFFVGVYDDFYKANFKLKFFLQIIVAKILIDQGFVITNYFGLFGLHEIPWLLAQITTIFVFIVVVNAINFIDGIDGLALTEVIKVLLIIEILTLNSNPLSELTLLLIFSIIPLYYFNFKKKRKIFLGDGGSLFLGTVIMVYLLYLLGEEIDLVPKYQINKVILSVSILLYPLFDLLRVFVLRIRAGRSPFVADQRHIHHFVNKKLNNHFLTTVTIQSISIILIFFLLSITKLI